MFTSQWKEATQKTIILNDITAADFKVILQYIYTGRVDLRSMHHPQVLDVLGAAHKYALTDLVEATVEYVIKSTFKPQTVLVAYRAARLYGIPRFKRACINFMVWNGVVVFSDDFLTVLSEVSY